MDKQRASMIERIVQRVEGHIEEWRRRDAAHAAEADANRDQLWAPPRRGRGSWQRL